MDDYDALWDKPDDAFMSDMTTPQTSFGDDHAHHNNHQTLSNEYKVGSEVNDDDRVDSAMDVDETMDDSQPSATADEEAARKLDYQFRSYNLRSTNVRDGKSVWITWLDTDDSGNYDPQAPRSEERMGRPLRRPESKRGRRSSSVQHSRAYSSDGDQEEKDDGGHRSEPRAAYLSRLAARQQGASITVTLELTTTTLRNLAAKIPDNWPGEDHNILSDAHYEFLAAQLNSRQDHWRPYNLRRRSSSRHDFAAEAEEGLVLPDNRIPDPLLEEVDLRNHPAARGCKACRQLGHDCSLLHEEFTWPCHACTEDGQECEMLTTPKKKRACEHCRKKRLPCSYVSLASNATEPCLECASHGFACVAGPDPSSIQPRTSYDRVAPIEDNRKYVTCTACRSEKKACSLRKKFDMPPCDTCHESGIPCTFLPLPRKNSAASLKKPKSKAKKSKERHDNAIYIRTALNHPIHFLHENDDECTWCTRNIGIAGRGMRNVLVIPSEDGLSYKEIKGGDNASGKHSDKMCIQCTMERCRILGCLEHEPRPIDDIDPEALDIAAMLGRIASGGPPHPEDRWCALCPAPALFQCCTPQDCDMWGAAVDPRSKEAEGCGLLLCEECAMSYNESNDLNAVIEDVGEQDEIWILGTRADAEFLKRGGLLEKNVMAPMADGEAMEVYE